MRKPPTLALVLVSLLTLAAGCGKEEVSFDAGTQMSGKADEKAHPKVGKIPYKVLKAGTLKADGTTLAGEGEILFLQKLPESNRYKLTFELDAGGALTLISNSDETLKPGLKITFFRIGKLVRLNVETRNAKGLKSNDETLKLQQIKLDGSKPITIELDVHGHGHFAASANGLETDPQISFSGCKGNFAGLRLEGVKVTDGEIAKSKDD